MIFIAIGSSIGKAEAVFKSAQAWLEHNGITVTQKSKNLKNPAIGGVAKNEFTNAVWQVEFPRTSWERANWILIPGSRKKRLKAYKLLRILKKCETAHGRTKSVRWADRTLDLDILMFDDLVLKRKHLMIPHPEIVNRSFVLRPWAELVDERFEIPTLGLLKDLRS